MKKEIAQLWCKALRSGEFKQIRGQLEKGDGHCALGVLALLALENSICTYDKGGKFDGRWQTLSYGIMNWAGIAQFDDQYLEKGAGRVQFTMNGRNTSLADLNDSGASFDAIADVIEKHWREF